MKLPPFDIGNKKGFTLLEIAIVMVIIGLLTGGGVSLMKMLTERKARNETVEYLQQAREALASFVTSQGRLPWADSDGDGLENNGQAAGRLPYRDLQMAPADPYRHVLRYVLNASLANNRAATCAALSAPLGTAPRVVDLDGIGTAFSVAVVLVSGGPMDADNDGSPFDAINAGTHRGNNATGIPNYLRHVPVQTFDDLTTYIGGNELFGQVCEFLKLAVNNNSAAPVYVYDVNRGTDLGSGSLASAHSATYDIFSGTTIEVRTAAHRGGAIKTSNPPTPIALAGTGATISIE